MARIFITGSADGLGQLAATALITDGHNVVLHARNNKRGQEALAKVPGAESVLTADLGEPRGCQMSDVTTVHVVTLEQKTFSSRKGVYGDLYN